MLKDVLTILFYATSVYVVLWLTYKLGRYRAEEAMADEVARLRQSRWKEGYTIGRERGHQEGYRDGYEKGRAEGYDDGRRYEAITHHNEEEIKRQLNLYLSTGPELMC